MSIIIVLAGAWLVLIVVEWSLFVAAARADRWGWQPPPVRPPGVDPPR